MNNYRLTIVQLSSDFELEKTISSQRDRERIGMSTLQHLYLVLPVLTNFISLSSAYAVHRPQTILDTSLTVSYHPCLSGHHTYTSHYSPVGFCTLLGSDNDRLLYPALSLSFTYLLQREIRLILHELSKTGFF